MRRWFAALLLALWVAPAFAAQGDPAGSSIVPFKATEKTLPNGLKVIVVPTGFPNLVSIQIPVLTGSRNEVEAGKSGFAHFFEHMMFRGTQAYPPDAYNALITKAGARQNAFTTDDFTNYHITFAKEDLEKILEIEADRFQNLSYPVEAFKTESRAVLGEYNKNSANPISKLFEVMRKNAYTTHTYKHTTMGFIEDIEDMPNQYEYSKAFFERWYRPANAALIVAGDVDPAKVMPLVEKYWGVWKAGTPANITVPQEPAAKGPVYAHVPWATPTAPWVAVAFHGPAFSETDKDFAAIDIFMDIQFGNTSDIYKKLVQKEQKVDQFFGGGPSNTDPGLIIIGARVKNPEDAVYVRDEILKTVAGTRGALVEPQKLEDAKSNAYYGLTAAFVTTEAIASTLAQFVRYRRSYDTINNVFRVYAGLTAEDLLAASGKYFTDANMVVTTLSAQPLAEAITKTPALASMAAASPAQPAQAAGQKATAMASLTPATLPQSSASEAAAKTASQSAAPAGPPLEGSRLIVQKTDLPQLNVKMVFSAGSASDPPGKEGLARLSASMIADAGSKTMALEEIRKAFFPMAAGFGGQVDKEMTTFTMSIHRDNWSRFSSIALPMLVDPGFRQEDFDRLRTNQKNSLTLDLRANNEEELGKEWLQNRIFAGTAYGHSVLGTVAGLDAITLDDVKGFVRKHYTTGNLKVGINGGAEGAAIAQLKAELGRLPSGATPRPTGIAGKMPKGFDVEIIQKDTRATAISFGHPIDVNRGSPDFAALNVARAWLGEHRASMSHLYDRIREVRGMNYGDYAYIEAFPRGMFQFFPDPNLARQKQIFEVWIRPVVPENAHMALRIALHEVDKMVAKGLTQAQFETTRDYLMKNVYVMTATQGQQVGYAIDSDWYGMGEYTRTMREALGKLTVADVNQAIKKHIHPADMKVVIITKDAEALKTKLASDEPSAMKYEAEKPQTLLDEDKMIGARKLGIKAEQIAIIPAEEVFAK